MIEENQAAGAQYGAQRYGSDAAAGDDNQAYNSYLVS